MIYIVYRDPQKNWFGDFDGAASLGNFSFNTQVMAL